MKIVHVINRFFPAIGGAERHAYLLSKLLAEKGHSVTVYTTNSITSDDIPQFSAKFPFVAQKKIQVLPKEEIIDGIVVKRFPVYFRFWSFLNVPEFTLRLFDEEADIFHIHGYQPFTSLCSAIAVKAKDYRKPTVLTTHDVEMAESLPHYAHALLRFYDNSAGKLLLKLSQRIIVLNYDDAIKLMKIGVPSTKLTYIPNGVDTEFFDPEKVNPENAKKFRQKFRLDKNIIVFVGRLEKRKRVDLVLLAFKTVLGKLKNCSLLIIGPDYGEFEFLKAFASKLGILDKVIFTHKLSEEELRVAYSLSDVLVMASEQEAFGLTLLEAMAMRVPVVAHSWKGMKYIVKDEKTGFLTNPGDTKDLAYHILRILTDKDTAKKMGGSARVYVNENFNIKKVVNQIEQLYFELTSQND